MGTELKTENPQSGFMLLNPLCLNIVCFYQATKEDFLGWLNDFMERKRERVKEEIDVDATLIAELVSRLQAEWEASWLEQPQARIVDASEEMDIQSDDDDE